MRIGRICRLRPSSRFKNPVIWFGVFAFASGVVLGPALAQGPRGAMAAATGAAAAATTAAPAPKKTAAMVAADSGNSAAVEAKPNTAVMPGPTEEVATDGATPSPVVTALGPPLKGVALQCANLLKMATDLKAEVDKTTKDVLSVAVIRDAGQIEATAKKMREQQH